MLHENSNSIKANMRFCKNSLANIKWICEGMLFIQEHTIINLIFLLEKLIILKLFLQLHITYMFKLKGAPLWKRSIFKNAYLSSIH